MEIVKIGVFRLKLDETDAIKISPELDNIDLIIPIYSFNSFRKFYLSLFVSFEEKQFWCEFLTLARNSHSKLFGTEGGNRTHTPGGTRF